MKRCYQCGTEWRKEKRPLPRDVCERCSAYIHCCLNCKFYDEHAHNHCKIPATEWVGNAEKSNFCDDFTFADRPAEDPQAGETEGARETWEQLWRDSD